MQQRSREFCQRRLWIRWRMRQGSNIYRKLLFWFLDIDYANFMAVVMAVLQMQIERAISGPWLEALGRSITGSLGF